MLWYDDREIDLRSSFGSFASSTAGTVPGRVVCKTGIATSNLHQCRSGEPIEPARQHLRFTADGWVRRAFRESRDRQI